MPADGDLPEYAFYYPNPTWHDGDWVKNLILFFDGIALLVPNYMRDVVGQGDPAIFSGLRDANLLHIVEPEVAVDQAATEKLATTMADVITSGVLDDLAKDGSPFVELSRSRLGGYGDEGLASMLYEELRSRKLASPSEDGVSIPMHSKVRGLVLVLLAQILRQHGPRMGAVLSPATDQAPLVRALEDLLSVRSAPSETSVISFDMKAIGIDVGSWTIDDVLSFRREHGEALRDYRSNVALFTAQVASLPDPTQAAAFRERQQALDDTAADIRKERGFEKVRQVGSFALGLTGAAWSAVTGDPVAAMLAAGGGLLSYPRAEGPKLGAYSYIFRSKRRFG